MLWRDVLVLGRLDETAGTVRSTVVVDVGGSPLLRQTTSVGADAPPGWAGPAGTGGHRVLGSVLLLGPDAPQAGPATSQRPAGRAGEVAVLRPEAGGALVTALGATTLEVTALLDGALRHCLPVR